MLEQLLAEIRQGGMLGPKALAARLNASPAMIEMMLEDLERRGFLKHLDQGCGSSCGGCSAAGFCSSQEGGKSKVWVLVR